MGGSADLSEEGFAPRGGAGEDHALGAQVGEDGQLEREGALSDRAALAKGQAVGAGSRDVIRRRIRGIGEIHGVL